MRRAFDRGVRWAATLCAGVVGLLILGLVGFVAWRGGPVLVGGAMRAFGEGALPADGLLYPFIGTLLLLAATLLISLPLAVAVALLHSVYLPDRAWRRRLRWLLYAFNSIPSIVLGIFGFLLFCQRFGWGKSWLAGGIVLALMILPTMSVALIERLDALPKSRLQAAYGLGLRRHQVVTSVILPHGFRGLLSGTLLGLARAAGETAPIMFTAAVFSGVQLPEGVVESPVLALPYHIFVSAQDSLDPAAQGEIWSAALLLLAIALSLGLASLPFRRQRREVQSG